MSAQTDLLDVLDEWLALKRAEAKGVDGPYVGWVYGHQEFNDEHQKDRAEIAARLSEALRTLLDENKAATPVCEVVL